MGQKPSDDSSGRDDGGLSAEDKAAIKAGPHGLATRSSVGRMGASSVTRGGGEDEDDTDAFLQRIISDNRAALTRHKRHELGLYSDDDEAAEEGGHVGGRTTGKRAEALGATRETKAAMNENLVKLQERGENVSRLSSATSKLLGAAQEFSVSSSRAANK